MTEPVYFFFAILGLVLGGALTWFVMATRPFEAAEEPGLPPDPVEPAYLANELAKRGHVIDEAIAAELLDIHRAYVEGRIREERAAYEARELDKARELERERRRVESEAPAAAGGGAASDRPAANAMSGSAADPATDAAAGQRGS